MRDPSSRVGFWFLPMRVSLLSLLAIYYSYATATHGSEFLLPVESWTFLIGYLIVAPTLPMGVILLNQLVVLY